MNTPVQWVVLEYQYRDRTYGNTYCIARFIRMGGNRFGILVDFGGSSRGNARHALMRALPDLTHEHVFSEEIPISHADWKRMQRDADNGTLADLLAKG